MYWKSDLFKNILIEGVLGKPVLEKLLSKNMHFNCILIDCVERDLFQSFRNSFTVAHCYDFNNVCLYFKPKSLKVKNSTSL